MPSSSVRHSRRELLRLGAGALGAALFAACGGGNKSELAPPGPVAVKVPILSSYGGLDGTPGGVLRLGVLGANQRAEALRRLTCSQLVAVDPRNAFVYSDLAESVELPEPLTVVFTLRPGLRFHPDAEGLAGALTAEDVQREFEARADAGEYLFTTVIERTEAPDQHTVVLRLRGRFSQLFESLADPATGAVRSIQRSAMSSEPLGSGPFVLVASGPDGDVLAPNPLYHRAGLPILAGIAVRMEDDERELANAFERGWLDVLIETGVEAEEVGEGRRDAIALQRPAFAMMGLGLSMLAQKGGRPVRSVLAFQDQRVRRAVSLALNRREILEQFAGLPSGPVGPAHGADALPRKELEAHPLYRHDPAGVRALLAAAGEPELAFTIRVPTQTRLRKLARLLEQQLAEAGFAPRLQWVGPHDWDQGFRAGDFEAAVFELDGLIRPDLGLRLHTSAGVEEGFSLWGYSNPVYDAAVREALSEIDPALRAARARDAQRLLMNDVPAMLPLMASVLRASVTARVRGYEYDAYGFNDGWLSARWKVDEGEVG